MSREQKIKAALSRSVCGGWDRIFLESILNQLFKGNPLSIKQKQTLGKVLARNTPEDEKKHADWASTYENIYKVEAMILGAYHLHQPYYIDMARDILSGKVPPRGKFLRMYDNKYSKKVLSQHKTNPKYKVGSYVLPRASFNSHDHCKIEIDMIWATQQELIKNFKRRGGFVLKVCEEIYSAAKGAKRYKLLPIGATIPVIVEERYLKAGKAK